MYHPTLEEVKSRAGQGNLAPVYQSINADLETPVSAYLKVARGPYSYLLESVEGGERLGRYSFIGTEPYKVLQTGAGSPAGEVDPLLLIEEEMGQYQLIPVDGLPSASTGGPSATWPTTPFATSSPGCRQCRLTPRASPNRSLCSGKPS